MATLTSSRQLDMGTFTMGSTSSHGSSSMKPSVTNGDDSHEPHSPNGVMESKSLVSSRNNSVTDDRIDDLENSTHHKTDNLPPEKQLGKLKRFLQTVFSFAEKVPAQKDRVKQLMIDLVNEDVSAQEFYVELRGSTKFPLRPFVVPFLESSLPLLRASLTLPLKPDTLETELFGTSSGFVASGIGPSRHGERSVMMENGLDRKRRAAGTSPDRGHSQSPKRSHFMSQQLPLSSPSPLRRNSAHPNLMSHAAALVNGSSPTLHGLFPSMPPMLGGPRTSLTTTPAQKAPNGTALANGASGPNGLTALTTAAAPGSRPDDITASAFQQTGNGSQANMDWWTCQNDEWRNIEGQRARLTQMWNEKFQQHQRQHDSNMKIEEMQRKADAAVQEVKRAAVSELQKAVHAAEQKALHMITTERAQMEKLLRDTQVQEESSENCRNCGRRAGQTCSGCGKARYCGVFCQHKDWPRHRTNCSGANDSNNPSDDVPATSSLDGTGSNEEGRSPPISSITVKTEFSPIEPCTRKKRCSPKSV